MGKGLVVLFLGSLLLGTVAAVLAVCVYLPGILLDILTLRPARIFEPSSFTLPFWVAVFFHVVLLYFTLVLAVVVLYFAVMVTRSSTSVRPPKPASFDVRSASIVAVVPAYDEEEAIGPVIDEFRSVPGVTRVIVVDNNSKDRTAEIARARGAEVVDEPQQGWGHACIRGLRTALERTDCGIIVLTEADMTYFGRDVLKLVPYLSEVEMALGARNSWFLTEAESQLDWFMTWGNMFVAFLVRLRFWDPIYFGRLRLSDVGCTLRAIRRDSLQRLMPQLTVGGSYFPLHMTMEAMRAGVSIAEVPVQFRKRVGPSKIAAVSRSRATHLGFQMIRAILLE
jgi:hypothetical protein